MTTRKADNLLHGDRTPAYVDRVTGAAELRISAETWDQWVKSGILPAPAPGFPDSTPRWRWEDVDRKLAGKSAENDADAFLKAASGFGSVAKKNQCRAA